MWKKILYLSWLVAAGCSDIADREYPEPQPAPGCDDRLAGYGADP